jgi:hypothetical protein
MAYTFEQGKDAVAALGWDVHNAQRAAPSSSAYPSRASRWANAAPSPAEAPTITALR